jgi:hypothetical protein
MLGATPTYEPDKQTKNTGFFVGQKWFHFQALETSGLGLLSPKLVL